MSELTGLPEDRLRQDYLTSPFAKKQTEMEGKLKASAKIIPGRDDCIIVFDDLIETLKVINQFLSIEIPHKSFNFIPTEMALDVREIEDDNEIALINKREIIKFLKTNLISEYRTYFKNYHGESIKKSFLICTTDFFNELDNPDKKYCKIMGTGGSLFYEVDLNRIMQRSMLFDFLETIGIEASNKYYDRIDELFVPPVGYEEISNLLKNERIVFIIGTQGYGKTFTSLYLLWQYYLKGYNPIWIKAEDPFMINSTNSLAQFEKVLKSHNVIYIEDPFGKIKYENNDELENEIGTLLDLIKNTPDVFVIITSREEVFKDFKNKQISKIDLKKFEKRLSIQIPSYNYKKRKGILLNYADIWNCAWYGTLEITNSILESMKDENILSSPFKISQFIRATQSLTNRTEVMVKLNEKSAELANTLSKEFKIMSKDKILFLVFPFISTYFKIDEIKERYYSLLEKLNVTDYWDFEDIVEHFQDSKITVNYGRISFSHSTYYEAFTQLIVKKPHEEVNRYLNHIFRILVEDEYIVKHMGPFLINHFRFLTHPLRVTLLMKIAQNSDDFYFMYLADLFRIIIENYTQLPSNVQNILHRFIADDTNSDPLPLRNTLLLAPLIVQYYNQLPSNVQNILHSLINTNAIERSLEYDTEYSVYSYGYLGSSTVQELYVTLIENYTQLPSNVQNILHRFIDRIVNNSSFPSNRPAFSIENTIKSIFDKIAQYYTQLPSNVQDILFRLSENPDISSRLVVSIIKYYDKLPSNVQENLHKLAENYEFRHSIGKLIMDHYNTLPIDISNKILLTISQTDNDSKTFLSNQRYWIGSYCYANDDAGNVFIPTDIVALSDHLTLHREYENLIPNKSWILYLLEAWTKKERSMSIALVSQFDGQNYFVAIFDETNVYRFKEIIPSVGKSYRRFIILDSENDILYYKISNEQDGRSEEFELSLKGTSFNFELKSVFTGLIWWNRSQDDVFQPTNPFEINYQIEVSNLGYGLAAGYKPSEKSYRTMEYLLDPTRSTSLPKLDIDKIKFESFESLNNSEDRLRKPYPVEFNGVRRKNQGICYTVTKGYCVEGPKFNLY